MYLVQVTAAVATAPYLGSHFTRPFSAVAPSVGSLLEPMVYLVKVVAVLAADRFLRLDFIRAKLQPYIWNHTFSR